ncbi:hypothetical protein CCUS01_17318 [Colletotrichum cuscutae]|uniref:Uncharacterized protein n=1 Tax=Colletotrichum cuscutae TaxID=1209917 RepID=A0AAI9V6X8_9PEZI|nr:hypothetical protein CCUS01_17318 [Colletotrichum cuscutae]
MPIQSPYRVSVTVLDLWGAQNLRTYVQEKNGDSPCAEYGVSVTNSQWLSRLAEYAPRLISTFSIQKSPSASSRPPKTPPQAKAPPQSPHLYPRPVLRRAFSVNRHSVPDRNTRTLPKEDKPEICYPKRPGVPPRSTVLPALFPFWHPHRPRRPRTNAASTARCHLQRFPSGHWSRAAVPLPAETDRRPARTVKATSINALSLSVPVQLLTCPGRSLYEYWGQTDALVPNVPISPAFVPVPEVWITSRRCRCKYSAR